MDIRKKYFTQEYIYLALESKSGCEVVVSCQFNEVSKAEDKAQKETQAEE